jgi:hypothetical protein
MLKPPHNKRFSLKYGFYTCFLSKESAWVEVFDRKGAEQETEAEG